MIVDPIDGGPPCLLADAHDVVADASTAVGRRLVVA
jgi:hypothetical protein